MLPPAPRNRAAEARATNAISRVYSMRSCPCSSFRKCRQRILARLGLRGSIGKLRVSGAPDRLDAAARAEKQRRRGQRHEGDQQSVFDQVLPLLVFAKVQE